MKRLVRPQLSSGTSSRLSALSSKVSAAADPKAEAAKLWQRKSKRTFDPIVNTLKSMAPGLERCVYCHDSQGRDIDHFWPKSLDPTRTFQWDNYFWACPICNSNEKRTQFPLDASGSPLLIDPVQDDPLDHLAFVPSTGHYASLSPKGTATITVFRLNDRPVLVTGRRSAWFKLKLMLIEYCNSTIQTDKKDIQQIICGEPFQGVFAAMQRWASNSMNFASLDEELSQVFTACPEILSWR